MEKEKFLVDSSTSQMSYGASSSPPNWQSSAGMDAQMGELNCSSDQLPSCFLNLNWENSMDQSVPYESALSSFVSSPVASNAAAPSESIVIRELIGRLGSICNSGEISPESQSLGTNGVSYMNNNSINNSCYSTPLNSPPKLNLSMTDQQGRGNLTMSSNSMNNPNLASFSADPGFAERAAKFSCFGSRNFAGLTNQFGFPESELPYRSVPRMESGKLSRVSSSQSLKAGSRNLENREMDGLEGEMRSGSASASDRKFRRLSRSSTSDEGEFPSAREESSGSDPIAYSNEMHARKRKAASKGKPKEVPSSPPAKDPKAAEDDSNAKRSKPSEGTANGKDAANVKSEQIGSATTSDGSQKQTKDNPNPPEPPKQDYIHVRARRGQATDSHSLAERVRREKISERMKFLQDLVPGCSKVTGKAVMLDEIINYVQSLQRQVESLSMKLATVNSRLDFNMETLLSKDMLQPRGSLPQMVYPLDSSASAFSYNRQPQQGPLQSVVTNGSATQCPANPLDATLQRSLGMQLPTVDGYGDASSPIPPLWEDDLQIVVQMGFGQNQEAAFSSQSFHGSFPNTHMKVEL